MVDPALADLRRGTRFNKGYSDVSGKRERKASSKVREEQERLQEEAAPAQPKKVNYKALPTEPFEMTNPDIVKQLYKRPAKENPMPHRQSFASDVEHQVDILYLPKDKKYSYALVVIDVFNSITDARPLERQEAPEIMGAMESIYAGPYLHYPKYLDADNQFGSQAFKDYCNSHNITLKLSKPYRSRQNAHVETTNGVIGKMIWQYELSKEISNQAVNTSWVSVLPSIIRKINDNRIARIGKTRGIEHAQSLSLAQFNRELQKKKDAALSSFKYYKTYTDIPMYSIVRIKLDKSEDYVSGKVIKDKRMADHKWSADLYQVVDKYLLPNNPILYAVKKIKNSKSKEEYDRVMSSGPSSLQLEGRDDAWYSPQQLQVIKTF